VFEDDLAKEKEERNLWREKRERVSNKSIERMGKIQASMRVCKASSWRRERCCAV
jgi:outer membrane lipopolysaccharide assembly protein LptE/RlpB